VGGQLADIHTDLREVKATLAAGSTGSKRERSASPVLSRSPSPPAAQQRVRVRSPPPAQHPVHARSPLETEAEELKRLHTENNTLKVSHNAPTRVPDLPKPPIFHGTNQDVVEDKLFVFENYLRGSKIPEDTWTNYIMPLLADKALSVWTAVAMPMSQAGLPLPWSLFRSTMLSSFAHPDRQHEAREMLHKVAKKSNQSVNDYVRHFNSLVQHSSNHQQLTRLCSFTLDCCLS